MYIILINHISFVKSDFVHTWYKCSLRAIKMFARKKSISVGVPFSAISTGSTRIYYSTQL